MRFYVSYCFLNPCKILKKVTQITHYHRYLSPGKLFTIPRTQFLSSYISHTMFPFGMPLSAYSTTSYRPEITCVVLQNPDIEYVLCSTELVKLNDTAKRRAWCFFVDSTISTCQQRGHLLACFRKSGAGSGG